MVLDILQIRRRLQEVQHNSHYLEQSDQVLSIPPKRANKEEQLIDKHTWGIENRIFDGGFAFG